MADFLADWFLIGCVIALVIVTWILVLRFIDNLIDYWRAYRDDS